MANPVIPNLDGSNPGPAGISTVNTVPPYSNWQLVETIQVTMTPAAVATITTAEQSFGANGVTFVTAATGIKAGDVILGVSAPSLVAGVSVASFRNDAAVNDKFYVTFVNPTAGSVTPVSGVYQVTVARVMSANLSIPLTSVM